MMKRTKMLIVISLLAVVGLGCSVDDVLSLIPDDKFEGNDSFDTAFDITDYPNTGSPVLVDNNNVWISDIDTGKTGVVGGDLALVTSVDEVDFYQIDFAGMSLGAVISIAFIAAPLNELDTVDVEIYDENEALIATMSVDGDILDLGDGVVRYDYELTIASETGIYLKVILTPDPAVADPIANPTEALYTLAWDEDHSLLLPTPILPDISAMP